MNDEINLIVWISCKITESPSSFDQKSRFLGI